MANAITSVEIIAPDSKGLAEFYHKVFGWTVCPPAGAMEYRVLNPEAENHVTAQMGDPYLNGESWLTFYVTVDDLDATIEAVLDNGGKLKMPKVTTDTGFTLAYVEDVRGHVLGLQQKI